MTALTLSTAGAATLRADALVVGVAKGPKGPVAAGAYTQLTLPPTKPV
ncbi:hypothetical protein ACFXPJ_18600 [Streptomyces goshikiensis]